MKMIAPKKPLLNELLLMQNIVEKVLRDHYQKYVFFGIRDHVEIAGRNHDLIFHAISNIPFENIETEPYLMIPVLHYGRDEEDVLKAYESFTNNLDITTFAVRVIKPKIVKSRKGRKEVRDLTLDFLDITKTLTGTEIIRRDEYLVANEGEFKERFENWDKLNEQLSYKREEINKKYLH